MFHSFFPFLLSLICIDEKKTHFVFDFIDTLLSLLKLLFGRFLHLMKALSMSMFNRFQLTTEIIVTMTKFLIQLSKRTTVDRRVLSLFVRRYFSSSVRRWFSSKSFFSLVWYVSEARRILLSNSLINSDFSFHFRLNALEEEEVWIENEQIHLRLVICFALFQLLLNLMEIIFHRLSLLTRFLVFLL